MEITCRDRREDGRRAEITWRSHGYHMEITWRSPAEIDARTVVGRRGCASAKSERSSALPRSAPTSPMTSAHLPLHDRYMTVT